MENYKSEILDRLTMWVSDNTDIAKGWVKEALNDDGKIIADDCVDYSRLSEYGVAGQLTGNDNGSYYCNAYKTKEALAENNALTDEDFLQYLRDSETHLEDLVERGWECVDVWYRCYVLDYHLTTEDIVGAIQQGIKQTDPAYEIKEIAD